MTNSLISLFLFRSRFCRPNSENLSLVAVEHAVASLTQQLVELQQRTVRSPFMAFHPDPGGSFRIVAQIGFVDRLEDARLLSWVAQSRMVKLGFGHFISLSTSVRNGLVPSHNIVVFMFLIVDC